MVFDISHLKKIRKQLNLTQHQFAKEANVSQSMIAKIESGKLDPTYSYVKKIEKALENLTKHHEKEAKDIMHRNIISLTKNQKISSILHLFSKHNISQIPVIEKEKIIGIISESSLINNIDKNFHNKTVEEIMEEPPPIITKNTKLPAITSILKFYPALIVQDTGKFIGIITKADIIKNL